MNILFYGLHSSKLSIINIREYIESKTIDQCVLEIARAYWCKSNSISTNVLLNITYEQMSSLYVT